MQSRTDVNTSSGVGGTDKIGLPNRISNKRTWDRELEKMNSTWFNLKAMEPDAKFYRDWNNVPLGMVTRTRAQRLGLDTVPFPTAYIITGDNQNIYPLYEVVYHEQG